MPDRAGRDGLSTRLSDYRQGAFILELGEDVLHLAGDLRVDTFVLRLWSEALAEIDRWPHLDRDLCREG
jgi:hypothetical protein